MWFIQVEALDVRFGVNLEDRAKMLLEDPVYLNRVCEQGAIGLLQDIILLVTTLLVDSCCCL